jgi:hypothetical protein
VWAASRWPNRKPLQRAVRWDGLFPIDLPAADALATLVDEVQRMRAAGAPPFDFVAEVAPGDELAPWETAGATWILTAFGPQPREAEVRQVIEAGPY